MTMRGEIGEDQFTFASGLIAKHAVSFRGGRETSEPGIDTHDRRYGFRARPSGPPRNDDSGGHAYFAPTAFLRQAKCTAQAQPGGWLASSFGSLSLAGANASFAPPATCDGM